MTVRTTDDPKLLWTAAPSVLGFSLKQFAAACLLSGLIAGTVAAFTGENHAENNHPSGFSINRVNKGDRLRSALGAQLPRNNYPSSAPEQRAPGQIPDGCERASDPIADPAHAHIVSSCLT